jgi:cell division protein FtsQ
MLRSALLRRPLPATAGIAAPADRRFRRPDIRPNRRRRLGVWLWRLVRVTMTVAVLTAAAYWTVQAVLRTPFLSIREFVVSGNRRLTADDVGALVEGMRGQSILRVDLDRYREELLDSPWIASASLRRVLPSAIEIAIVERVPIAIARLNQHLYVIDNTGIIIGEFGPRYRKDDLPVVDGLVRTSTERLPAVEDDRVDVVVRLLDDLGSVDGLRQRVSQIDVSDPRDVVILLEDDQTLVHLGDARFAEHLKTYLELAPTLREQLRDVDSVDMRFDARVYARSKGRTPAPAAAKDKPVKGARKK